LVSMTAQVVDRAEGAMTYLTLPRRGGRTS
jgi:hypothetical protein